MVKFKGTFTIHRRDDPTGVNVVKVCDRLKSFGAEVELVRMTNFYKIIISDFTSVRMLVKAVEDAAEQVEV